MTRGKKIESRKQSNLIGELVETYLKKAKRNGSAGAQSSNIMQIQNEVEAHCTTAMKYSSKDCQENIHENLRFLVNHHSSWYDSIKNDWDGYFQSNIIEIIGHEKEYKYLMARMNGHT